MFVDEQVWRTENKTAEQRRDALAIAFHHEHFFRETATDDLPLGIGGGYGQFGILTEEEFLKTIKTSGKRTQRFMNHENQFKDKFNKMVIHRKDDGLKLIGI